MSPLVAARRREMPAWMPRPLCVFFLLATSSPRLQRSTSLSNWRLRLPGGEPCAMARNDLLSVADAIGVGTPENVFARKRSIEAWCRGDPSDRRHRHVPAAGTVPRTSPRRDESRRFPCSRNRYVVVYARYRCSSGRRDLVSGRPRAGLGAHLGAPRYEPGTGRELTLLEVSPQGDQEFAGHRDDAHLAGTLAVVGEPPRVPAAQGAVWFPAQPGPGHLHHHPPQRPVAGLFGLDVELLPVAAVSALRVQPVFGSVQGNARVVRQHRVVYQIC